MLSAPQDLPRVRTAHVEGELVGGFRVAQLIGRGSFGEVFLGENILNGRLIALKTVPCNPLESESFARAHDTVVREGELLRKLQHPNIVACEQILWDSERQRVWLFLELMNGGSLKNLIETRRSGAQGPFQAHFVLKVHADIGSALSYLHASSVLHRDVKPANVLLSLQAPPSIKLADFGVSKVFEATGCMHSRVGTEYYLSPEIAKGEPYGPASDDWALGVCLYELASLQRPFTASNPIALGRLICEKPFPPLPPELPYNVVSLITGLLEKDPRRRAKAGLLIEIAPDTLSPEIDDTDVEEFVLCTPRHSTSSVDVDRGVVLRDGWVEGVTDPDGLCAPQPSGVGWFASFVNALRPAFWSSSDRATSKGRIHNMCENDAGSPSPRDRALGMQQAER